MTARRAPRTALLLGLLCIACVASGAAGAIAPALGASARPSSQRRDSHRARVCRRRGKHRRRCPRGSSRKRLERTRPAAPRSPGAGVGTTAPASTGTTSGGTVSGTLPAGPDGEVSPVQSTPPPGPAHVQVTAEDGEAFRFILSRPSVPAGRVVIEFVNHGQDEHNLNAVEAAEGTVAGSLPNTAPNAHPSLSLDMRQGSYTLFCSLPGHEAKGMKATLVVTAPETGS